MKKLFLISCLFFVALHISPVNAQVKLGIQAGANFSDVSMDPEMTGVETGIRTGLILGGILVYDFSPLLSLQVEPAYVMKGSSVDMSIVETEGTIEVEGTLSADYFDIPVLLKASFGEGPVKPYLMAGLSIAFLMGDATIEMDKATLNGEDVISYIPSDEREQKLETKSNDFILNFGGGVTIPLKTLSIFIEGQYNLGLTNLNDDPEDNTEIKTKGIQVKAGILFPL